LRNLDHLTSLIASRTAFKLANLAPVTSLKVLVLDRCRLSGVLVVPNCSFLETLIVSHNDELTEIDLSECRSLKKLSASHNAMLTRAPEFETGTCATCVAEVRLAHCPSMVDLDGVCGNAGIKRLAVLDLSHCKALREFAQLSHVCGTGKLQTLNVRGTTLRNKFGDDEDAEFRAALFEAVPQARNSLLNAIDGVAIPDSERPASVKFLKDAKRKEVLRSRNLISTKLNQPDPLAIRNKPCPCGSGKKYKVCCEGGDVKTASVEEDNNGEKKQRRKKAKINPPPEQEDDDDAVVLPAITTTTTTRKPQVEIAHAIDEEDDFEHVQAILVKTPTTPTPSSAQTRDLFSGVGKW
jgi:hypothetical protein